MAADWKRLCEGYYQDYLNGKFTFSIMPYELYDEFVKCGMMAEDAYTDWNREAEYKIMLDLKESIWNASSASEKDDFEEHLRKLENGKYEWKIVQQAKKLAVQFLYKEAKKKGFKQLFEKENK